MTRFARAKGSKASNEKAPEDSTPWEVMKEQIMKSKKESEEAKLREEAEKQRIDNYNNFLKEHKVQKRKATWCDFPEGDPKNKVSLNADQCNDKVHKKTKKNKIVVGFDNQHLDNTSKVESEVPTTKTSELSAKQRKKKKKNKSPAADKSQLKDEDEANHQVDNSFQSNTKSTISQQIQNGGIKKKKNKKESKLITEDKSAINHEVDKLTEINSVSVNSEQTQNTKKKIKKSNSQLNDNNVEKGENAESQNNQISAEKNKTKNINVQNSKKKKKDQKPIRRKAINDKSFQLIINGKEIELVRYDGFPIMKKDAERLEELKNNMIKKGIPKSEVQRTMKLERRRAEKALARIKREVCYNCRKGGHNLSDCPDLKSKIPGVDAAEGVCFKCGSTEHRQFECKVQRDKEFRFATCFICKEPGHIARQCPDNPKGLYPNGGCCKLCGDVTHLKKDCPTTNYKKEETSIKLQTLDDTDNIEDISQKVGNAGTDGAVRKPKKIKF